ncbi:YbhB/YbcL family Raf kinase inhibitor-like protein [Cerasicoccus maritimus]|uniref:YbhB/YbcL family Raf kinase inhibitor-like protein n=1 Tax=Cerasicoccus maritimus TaxID=490089 RepID=UPI002852C9E7|nr:hypothetical protein [Cerasicoccus maritimus]
MALDVLSPAFVDGGSLPELYYAQDSEFSPPLEWSCDSSKVASYVLVVDEPNEHGMPIVHWVVYNIPRNWRQIPENYLSTLCDARGQPEIGLNDWARVEWVGQTEGRAMLRFRLYAISRKLSFSSMPNAYDVLSAAQRYILDDAKISAYTH